MYQKENSSWLKHADFILLDIISLQMAFVLSYWMRLGKELPYTRTSYGSVALVLVLIQILVTFFGESFSGVLRRGWMKELKATLVHTTLVILLALAYLFFSKQASNYSRLAFGAMWVFYTAISYCIRMALKEAINARKSSEGEKRSLLVVTSNEKVEEVMETIQENNYGSFHLAGIVLVDCDRIGQTIHGVPVVADVDNTIAFIHKNWVDEVFFALPRRYEIPENITKDCATMGVTVHTYLARGESSIKNQLVEEIAGYTVLSQGMHIVTPRQIFLKRCMDVAGGLVGCLATALITIVIAPMIKIKSPGPVFFSQIRVGKNGRPFKIYKFRSMYMDAEERKKELMEANNIKDGLMFKMDDDPRIIKGIGHFIRKTSLDEFPQFWNILKGDMSLVGTRPPTMDEWEKYELHHRKRLAIKPGLTGMWQVSGRSEITDFEEVVALDTKYISEWSLSMDIKIIIKTIKVVLMGSGAK
jgi:exopolysaccharide biosynthesis polyprenyl glycosylphosphotransferase